MGRMANVATAAIALLKYMMAEGQDEQSDDTKVLDLPSHELQDTRLYIPYSECI